MIIWTLLLFFIKDVTSQVYFQQDLIGAGDYQSVQKSFWQIYNNIYYYNLYRQQTQHGHGHQHHHSQQQEPDRNGQPASLPATDQKFINSIEDRRCEEEDRNIDYLGLISWLLFCVFVLLVGVWAGCSKTKRGQDTGHEGSQEQMMLAGRDINMGVGVLTMAATWVGGGFLNGAAQGVYTRLGD